MQTVSVQNRKLNYPELLGMVQSDISKNHAAEYQGMYGKPDAESRFMDLVSRCLLHLNILSTQDEDNELVSRLFEDMSGMSFLGKYLRNLDRYPDLEEISGNAWNSIVFKHSGGRTEFKSPDGSFESFLSPQHSIDVINRIVTRRGGVWNESVPEITSDIATNVRITAKRYPIIPKKFGAAFSIRITRPHNISSTNLIETGTASAEMIGLLQTLVKYMVSMCVSGKQYAGKTTLINFLLAMLPPELRIYLIEEGSRELDLIRYDSSGRMANQVIPNLTRPDENSRQMNFDAETELKFGLRYDVDVFVPQEMRGAETISAVECARTGSMVVTTIHANDAMDTYSRIMTLMQLTSKQSEDTLMRLAVDAFPVIIHMRRLRDGLPRIMEVMEGVRYSSTHGVSGNTLYRYAVEDNIENPDGTVTVKGHFERVHGISERLQRILLNSGAPLKLVREYARE